MFRDVVDKEGKSDWSIQMTVAGTHDKVHPMLLSVHIGYTDHLNKHGEEVPNALHAAVYYSDAVAMLRAERDPAWTASDGKYRQYLYRELRTDVRNMHKMNWPTRLRSRADKIHLVYITQCERPRSVRRLRAEMEEICK